MRSLLARRPIILALAAALYAGACAKVPPEVVRLSSVLGEDIVATQTSYQLLVTQHFDNLRTQANMFVDTRWRPVFIRRFIVDGKLMERVKDPNSDKALNDIGDWALVAVETIEAKRRELLDPIDADEKTLRLAVDDAFNRMIQANNAVTAHLNSIREVSEFQDGILQAAGVRELRDKINDALIKSSDRAEQAIDAVAKADKVITNISEQLR
jgi:hypothetical protein